MPIEDRRSIYRLACGITLVFSLGMFLGWPLSVIGAVFTALFLQAPAAMPMAVFTKLFWTGFVLMAVSFLISSVALPYPPVYLTLVALAIILSFVWSISGAGMLQGILALMAALMIPNLSLVSQELAAIMVFWVPMNLLIAGAASRLMFAIFPAAPPTAAQAAAAKATPAFDPRRRIVRMSLVTVPFAMLFFVSGASALLVLFFVAILSQQLAAMPKAGKTVAKAMLTANLLGAAASIVCYEINVIAPVAVTPFLLIFFVGITLGTLGKSQHWLAASAGSAITTVLIVYGGSISPFSDEADVKSIVRVMQIAFAASFVIIAFIVVDEFWPEKQRKTADAAQD